METTGSMSSIRACSRSTDSKDEMAVDAVTDYTDTLSPGGALDGGIQQFHSVPHTTQTGSDDTMHTAENAGHEGQSGGGHVGSTSTKLEEASDGGIQQLNLLESVSEKNMVDSEHTAQIGGADPPIPKPCSSATTIKISGDITLSLVPRVKLDFTVCCKGGFKDDIIVDELILKGIATAPFRNSYMFRKTFFIPDQDVRVRYRFPLPLKLTEDNQVLVAEGKLFIRDRHLKYLEPVKNLAQLLDRYEVKFFNTKYVVKVFSPTFPEVLSEKMNSVSGVQDLPTITLKGIPSQWFVEESDSSTPSKKLLHIFLETFGKIRVLDVVEDDEFGKDARNFPSEAATKSGDGDPVSSILYCKVFVQYETYKDFENALKNLCTRSLQKSALIADYEVSCPIFDEVSHSSAMMRDYESWPTIEDVSRGVAVSSEVDDIVERVTSTFEGFTKGIQNQLEALQHQIEALKEEVVLLRK